MTSGDASSRGALLRADLEDVLERSRDAWGAFRGARIFVTGGTGFVGKWLLETFNHANDRLALGASAVVLSRQPSRFAAAFPHLAGNGGIQVVAGDVRAFEPPAGSFSHVVHAAVDVASPAGPLEVFDTIVAGTRRVLEFASERAIPELLFVSSGAVYGEQPADLACVPETFRGAPETTRPQSAYGEGKRAAEWLASAYGVPAARIARCFAFVGPYLPLDASFAIGNFIGDKCAGRPIEVKGNGTAVRSYLYASDLARWLWTILANGRPGEAYNVGSEEGVTVRQLAERVAAIDPCVPVVVGNARASSPETRYVPSTRKAREQLGLTPAFPLDESILRTLAWARAAR